ncbi:SusC/RagA family TonB-linked outer membrane protein [Danxiaibacter flavus]|uniref:SusC/RagA family TonB-linked outer membrane protein n=1 Tax=Danxiaibacter flavus TaxID=3049108 RepID=A0ABV3ZMH9_9BACT|nr:SusC/RagA family TonB-linked outer membrane protein [Chitinophagaceae bacterium DXS]
MKKLLVLLFFTTCFCLQTKAQQFTASGSVVDEYGRPLQGVTIKSKRTAATVVSGDGGLYSIQAQPGDVLQFNYPNYNAFTATVHDSSFVIAVKLTHNVFESPDSVNVLYEVKRTDKILGSVASIYTNQLTTTPSSLYAYALTGRLPGLYTQQTRGWQSSNSGALVQQDVDGLYYPNKKGLGGPNDNTEINMTLRGQQPVTIVDGVQRDIYTIDPENIESVSVLKDGLSTILLGQRSSRGVVLVTTKKPVSGKPHVSLTAQTGVQTPLGLPDPLAAYQYAYLYNEAQSNENKQLSYTEADFKAYRDHTDPYGHPDVNWFNTILKKSSTISRYSLNVTGGGGAARYAVGLSYLGDNALFNGSNPAYETNATIKRYTINSNIDVDVTKEFNVKLQMFARVQEDNQPGATTDAIISQMYTTPNNAYPVYNPDGSFGGTQAYPKNLYAQLTQSGYMQGYSRDIFSNLDLNYKFDKFVPGLWAKVQSNISVFGSNTTDRSAGVPSFKFSVSGNDTTYNRYGAFTDQVNNFNLTYSAQFWYLQGALGYTRSIKKNNFTVKAFYDRYESIFNYDLPETNQNVALAGSYDYDGKYFAEAAVNYSGNDRYPPGKQFGLFYAAGLGWNIARENFIKDNISWINRLKLRATYGKTGNDNVGYFTWRESYQLNIVNPTYPIGINRASQAVTQQNILANPNVTWEKGDKFNVGLDAAFFKNRFLFTADYYNDRYSDLLQYRGKQTALIGIGYPLENLGINNYSGVELTATYQDHVKDFNYAISGNVSFQQSRVVYSNEIEQKYPWNVRTGQPVGMTFGYISQGLIQTQKEAESSPHPAGYTMQPGDIKYADLNGDGLINQYDQAAIGEKKPLIFYGVTGNISYKGFDISVLLQGVGNRRYILNDYSFGSGTQQGYSYIVGRWTPETGTASTFPRLTPGINTNNDVTSTWWQRSGNYFRLKNAEIGYSLPYRVVNRLKLNAVRFFANGLNLLTHADFSRVDPEVYGQVYPNQRIINFGVNVKF